MQSLPSVDGLIADLPWHSLDGEPGVRGVDLCFVRPAPWPILKLARLSWPDTVKDGWRRYAWSVVEVPDPFRRLIVIMAAPDVLIRNFMIDKALVDSAAQAVLWIVRTQSADQIPQEDEPLRIGNVLNTDMPVVASALADLEAPYAGEGAENLPRLLPSSDLARLKRLADGVLVIHQRGDWDVRVKVDPRLPAAFWIDGTADPMGYAQLARSAFQVRVISTGSVTVTVQQRSTRAVISPEIGRPGGRIHDLSNVTVLHTRVTLNKPIPLSGLDPANIRDIGTTEQGEVTIIAEYPEAETLLLEIIPGFYGMIPIAGPLFDLGFLIYAAAYGTSITGEDLKDGDLLLMGIFAALGVGLEFGGPLLKAYKSSGDTLFPGKNLVVSR